MQPRGHVNGVVRRRNERDRRPYERALKLLCPELLCPAVRLATPLAARLARVTLPAASITIGSVMAVGESRIIRIAIFLTARRIRLFMREKLIHHIKLIKIVRRSGNDQQTVTNLGLGGLAWRILRILRALRRDETL